MNDDAENSGSNSFGGLTPISEPGPKERSPFDELRAKYFELQSEAVGLTKKCANLQEEVDSLNKQLEQNDEESDECKRLLEQLQKEMIKLRQESAVRHPSAECDPGRRVLAEMDILLQKYEALEEQYDWLHKALLDLRSESSYTAFANNKIRFFDGRLAACRASQNMLETERDQLEETLGASD